MTWDNEGIFKVQWDCHLINFVEKQVRLCLLQVLWVSHWFKQNQINMQYGKMVYHTDDDSVFIKKQL